MSSFLQWRCPEARFDQIRTATCRHCLRGAETPLSGFFAEHTAPPIPTIARTGALS